jgi:NADH-ubiquinone oxidoreductase chain 5
MIAGLDVFQAVVGLLVRLECVYVPATIDNPTPVSAWVHSSTLVTAGVYLLIHRSPSFGYWLNVFLLLISGLTIFIAGLGANFDFDLRRLICFIYS